MFEQAESIEPRNALSDWMLRGSIGVLFILFGVEKFPSRPGSEWVVLFQQIGIGQWFRYFTGVVEVAGGVLVLIPRTARAGLALLAVTMAAAALILDLVIRHPGDSVFSTAFCVGLSAFWWARRSR